MKIKVTEETKKSRKTRYPKFSLNKNRLVYFSLQYKTGVTTLRYEGEN